MSIGRYIDKNAFEVPIKYSIICDSIEKKKLKIHLDKGKKEDEPE